MLVFCLFTKGGANTEPQRLTANRNGTTFGFQQHFLLTAHFMNGFGGGGGSTALYNVYTVDTV